MEFRRAAPIIGLCALLVADLVLIVMAFRPGAEDPGSTTSTPVSSAVSSGSTPSASPSGSPSGSAPTASPGGSGPAPAPVARFVAAVDDSVAWVVDAGSCTEPGRVWVTEDGGDSWSVQDAPGRVLRARPSSSAAGFVTGGDASCRLRLWSTGDAGGSWSEPQSAADAWSRAPEDATEVHTPADEVVRPCARAQVLDLSALGAAQASVLCANGDLRTTTDGGSTWPRSVTVDGGLALAVTEGGQGSVARSDPSCEGVVTVAVVSGKPRGRGTCVEGAGEEGQVSVSGAGGRWWLLVGDRLHRSAEPAGPWTPAGKGLPG